METNILIALLKKYDSSTPNFRPTEIYNEGWLLRIILNEYSKHENSSELLKFFKGATWFSEAMLPTKFKARLKEKIGDKDRLAESRTNADGVIGHIKVGTKGKADLELTNSASQFVVIEAKMNSKLSKNTSNVSGYDQAARTVACMAETIQRNKKVSLKDIKSLAYIVLAPAGKFEEDPNDRGNSDFWTLVNRESIKKKVKSRVEIYKGYGDYENWYYQCFEPTLEKTTLEVMSWETVIENLSGGPKDEVERFYKRCLTFN